MKSIDKFTCVKFFKGDGNSDNWLHECAKIKDEMMKLA